MKPTASSDPDVIPARLIVFLYVLVALTWGSYSFISGQLSRSEPWFLTNWAQALSVALILEYGRRLSLSTRGDSLYRGLVFAPAFLQFGYDMCLSLIMRSFEERQSWRNLLFGLAVLMSALMLFGVRMIASAYIPYVERPSLAVEPKTETTSATNEDRSKDAFSPLLGQGDTYLDRVIKSVILRSLKSERAASFSLSIMLVLVMIGGMASFGLWAFTHADRINSLETERNKLMVLESGVREVQDKLTTGSEEAKAQLTRLLTFIDQNYKEDDSYKATFNKLSVQSQTNAADIAIRVTIAVLTIFLVQVFFAVYKYNHHLAAMLAAKAEALELVGNDSDARKRLSREAATIVREGVPGFGPQPRTPIEEATRVAERFGKRA